MPRLAVAVTLIALSLPGAAAAQAAICQGRVFVDSVYQTGLGGARFEYFFLLRNQTNSRITVNVRLQDFPSNVTLFSPTLPDIPLGPYAILNLRFGQGTNPNISAGTVRVVHDAMAAGGPTIRMTNCRAM